MDFVNFVKGYFKVDDEHDLVLRKKRKKWLFITAVIAVLVVSIIGIGAGVSLNAHNRRNHSPHWEPSSSPQLTPAATLKTVCGVTRYPDACVSSISKIPSSNTTTDPLTLFNLSLKVVVDELGSISDLPKKLADSTSDETLKSALGVCGELIENAMDHVNDTVSAMEVGDGTKILDKSKIHDFKTWLSSALTYHQTCFDALEELSQDKTESATISQNLKSAMRSSTEYTSNSLAIVAKVLSALKDFQIPIHGRRLLNSYPSWVRPGVRRLLETPMSYRPHVTVAADGSGDFKTVQEAVDMVPSKSKDMFLIYVKAGTYNENVVLDKSKWNVLIYGDGMTKTIISGSKNVADGTPTFWTATFVTQGRGFIMKDIGVINTAGPAKHQAVALRSDSDRSVYYRCSFDGYQDTLYPHSNRQFYRNCDVTGTVDFIFGNAAVVFQRCNIRPRQPLPGQFNTITAQGKNESLQNTGISIQYCTISPNGNVTAPTYLGRPWKEFSTTVVMQSKIGAIVKPAGVLNSLASRADAQSLSVDSLMEVYGFLLELSQDAVSVIIESREDVWKNKDLRSLVDVYFKSTSKTLDFCNTVENCVKKTEISQLIIRFAVKQFEAEDLEGNKKKNKYAKTLEELNKFKAMGDPFDGEFVTPYESVYEEQVLLLEELRKLKVKLDKKQRNVKTWRILSNVVFATAFVSVLVLSVVAAAMSAPPVISAVAAGSTAPIEVVGKWFNDMWKEYEKAVKRQRGLVLSIEIGAKVNNVVTENIRVEVDKLRIKILWILETVEFAVEREEEEVATRLAMQEIKKKVDGFTEKIEEVGENAAKCSKFIALGRLLVLGHIL
ncbi:hypothetical protein AALP_AA8G504100, partial [Arabis alpina]